MSGERVCACGCGRSMEGRRRNAHYYETACRTRHWRRRPDPVEQTLSRLRAHRRDPTFAKHRAAHENEPVTVTNGLRVVPDEHASRTGSAAEEAA
jgi:hypothetical protein